MMILADVPFATSISGYLLAILVPVLLALFLRKADKDAKFRSDMVKRFDQQDNALTQTSKGLAVLIQRVDDSALTLAKVPGLSAAVEVLTSRINEHIEWSNTTRRELLDDIEKRS